MDRETQHQVALLRKNRALDERLRNNILIEIRAARTQGKGVRRFTLMDEHSKARSAVIQQMEADREIAFAVGFGWLEVA